VSICKRDLEKICLCTRGGIEFFCVSLGDFQGLGMFLLGFWFGCGGPVLEEVRSEGTFCLCSREAGELVLGSWFSGFLWALVMFDIHVHCVTSVVG